VSGSQGWPVQSRQHLGWASHTSHLAKGRGRSTWAEEEDCLVRGIQTNKQTNIHSNKQTVQATPGLSRAHLAVSGQGEGEEHLGPGRGFFCEKEE